MSFALKKSSWQGVDPMLCALLCPVVVLHFLSLLPPFFWLKSSLADIPFHCSLTVFTGDVAAPVILAVAALHHSIGVHIVASTAAHQTTAVTSTRCLVTIPEEKIKQCISQWGSEIGNEQAYWFSEQFCLFGEVKSSAFKLRDWRFSLPVLCAVGPMFCISLTVVRWADKVDKFTLSDRSHIQLFGNKLPACANKAMDHFCSREVLGL